MVENLTINTGLPPVYVQSGMPPINVTIERVVEVSIGMPPLVIETIIVSAHSHDDRYYKKDEIDDKFEEFTPDLTPIQNALNDHLQDTNNPHEVTKDQVGLGSVDNTSDINKPISNAVQTALNDLSSSITALIGGAPTDANTLKKLNDKILNILTLLGSDNVNLDNVQELVDAIETIQISLSTILVNDLTTGGTTKALSAEQGKVLKGLIDAIPTGVTPGGSSSNVQINKNGALYGDDQLTYDDVTKTVDIHATLGSEKMPSSPSSLNSPWTGDATYYKKSSNGTGALSFQVNNKAYERYFFCIEIFNLTPGSTCLLTSGGWNIATISANGLYKFKVTTLTTGALVLTPSNTARFDVKKSTLSYKKMNGGTSRSGTSFQEKLITSLDANNYQPGTNDHHEYINPSGQYIHVPFKFGTVQKSAISAVSDGSIELQTTSGNGVLIKTGSNLLSQYTVGYLTGAGIIYQGYGAFSGKVIAGLSNGGSINSKFAVWGSKMEKRTYIKTQNYTLDDSIHYILDTSDAIGCAEKVGQTLPACSTYSTQSACEAKGYLGCYFQITTYCSDYNGYPDDCTNAGCTNGESNCSEIGDEYTCNSTSPCYYSSSTQYCSDWNYDQSSCESNIPNGCSPVYDDYDDANSLYFYEYTDQTACEGASGSWIETSPGSGTYTCRGPYQNTCNGEIYYSVCEGGSYYNGNCNGGTIGSCLGNALCGNVTTSSPCNALPQCEWTSVLNTMLPNSSSFFYYTSGLIEQLGRDYKIIIIGSGNVNLKTLGNDKYMNNATAKTLSPTKNYELHFFGVPGNCVGLDESQCNSNPGCSPTYTYDEGSMSYSYDGCSGNYVKDRYWSASEITRT